MSQENSIEEDQSSDLSLSFNLEEEHLSENENLATVFDSLLFDFEERNLLASLRVNLKKVFFLFFLIDDLLKRKSKQQTFFCNEESSEKGQTSVRDTSSNPVTNGLTWFP